MSEIILHKMAQQLIEFPEARHSSFFRSHAKAGYDLNKQGFRCTAFETRKDINVVTVGCSNALGWCVQMHQRYSAVFCKGLAEATGKSVNDWNLGLPAKSNDYNTRMVWTALSTLKPDIVLVGFTGMSRREYWDCTGKCIDYVPSNYPDVIKTKLPQEMHLHKKLHLLQSEWDNVSNFIRNFKTIESLLNGKPWYFSFSSGGELGGNISESIEPIIPQDRYVDYLHIVDKATDGWHPGPESHKMLGEKMLQRYLNEFVGQTHIKRSDEVIRYL